jgi:ABC-type Fe3+ transport system substrate-binding protein
MAASSWSRREAFRLGGAAAAGLAVAACGTSASSGGPSGAATGSSSAGAAANLTGSALESAAKAEGGHVVWYNSGNPNLVASVSKAFTKAYPWASVAGTPVAFSDLPAKLISEKVTSAPTADVTWFPPTLRQKLESYSIFQALTLAGDKNMPASTLDPQNYAHPVWQLGVGLVYDPKVVASPPKTPQDLADPQWKGQIAFDRVQNLGQSTTWLAVWKQQMGASAWESWIDDLQKQDIFLEPDANSSFTAVQQGQKKLGISASNYVFSQPAGGAITMDFNIQVVPFYNHQYLTVRAQHPASAKLFMEFASSSVGQTAISTVGLSPIMNVDTPNTLAKFIPKGTSGLLPGNDESDFVANTSTYVTDLSKRWPG